MKNTLKTLLVLLMLSASVFAFAGGAQEPAAEAPATPENPRVKLATTTSTENSGLLAVLIPAFEEATGYKVDVIAVGTGKAIAHGEAGDVDLIMVHARSREDAFVADGYGVNRRDLMHNDFVILGPDSDPAGIAGGNDSASAFAAIAAAEADFVSRGDDSGTHTKEKAIWAASGADNSGKWYKEAGQGMGAVITMTNDMQGYTLTDRGTYLAMKDDIELSVVVEGDPILFNPYGVIAVNPELHSHVNYEGAMSLIEYVTGAEGQAIIAGFQKNGEQLFYPDVIK
ncbi:MAG: substrate-binding domain-containing protein [Spirochaetales bacterium]|uniref:Substrate-binding domain-containing protein n=1 Tax=Candidatus Thalassospirochaeta sargassi TaxID=3119039 RepID=A0AAJ1MKL2_9SPIO|nr:substrate-binding domain-containing protein [Spirochaetales bacterium]